MEICSESADAILTLTRPCSQLESFHVLCFVPLFVQAAADAKQDILACAEKAIEGGVEAGIDDTARARGGSNASATSMGSSLSELAGDTETARRSLTDRALEQLAELSKWFPSASKAASELQRASSRRGSASKE